MWAVSKSFSAGTYNIGNATNGNAIPYHDGKTDQKVITVSAGNNERHNNVAPCVSAYLWQRTV